MYGTIKFLKCCGILFHFKNIFSSLSKGPMDLSDNYKNAYEIKAVITADI